jgi:hypothetical protein
MGVQCINIAQLLEPVPSAVPDLDASSSDVCGLQLEAVSTILMFTLEAVS